ncbi:hypothetical protein GQ42DRAFT_164313, partial [Ramicandelaber brevisporus]
MTTTTNDSKQKVGEKANGSGDEPRGRGKQIEHAAGKTRMPATPTWQQRDSHHGDRTPRQHTPAPGDNEGTTPMLEGSLDEESACF